MNQEQNFGKSHTFMGQKEKKFFKKEGGLIKDKGRKPG